MLNRLNIIKGTYDDNKIELRVQPKNKDIYALRRTYLTLDLTSSVFIIPKRIVNLINGRSQSHLALIENQTLILLSRIIPS